MKTTIITLNKPVGKSIIINGIEFKGICFISPESLYPILHKGVELDTLPVETQELFKLCVKAEWNEIEYDQTIRFEYTKVELDLFKSYYKGLDKNVIKTILTTMGFDEYSINDLNRIVELENPNNDDIKDFTSLVSLVIGYREHFRFNTDDGSQSRLSLNVDNLREELEYYFEGCSISEVDQISFHLVEKGN